eukprot:gene15484-biopygen14264
MQIGAEGTGLNCDAHLWWQNKVFRVKWRRAAAGGGGGSWRRRRRRRRILLQAAPINAELWQTMREIISFAPQAPEKVHIPPQTREINKKRRRRRRGSLNVGGFPDVKKLGS